MLDLNARKSIALTLIPLIEEAGHIILAARAAGYGVSRKADESPVSDADMKSQAHLGRALAASFPDIPVISEEDEAPVDLKGGPPRVYFLVDPLDGTREFISGRDEFTVNIALVEDGQPTVGLLLVPALDLLYVSWGDGACRKRVGDPALTPLQPGPHDRAVPVIVASASHLDVDTKAFLEVIGQHETRSLGSALKFALIAAGDADLYPRFGPTMPWDTAAGQALVESMGGVMLRLDGAPLRYQPIRRHSNPAFLAAASPTLALHALQAWRTRTKSN